MKRRDKINYYLDIAETVLERSTCIRRNFGAIIVKNDEIISTGYNGAPRGRINCSDSGNCFRDSMNIPKGRDTNCAVQYTLNKTLLFQPQEQILWVQTFTLPVMMPKPVKLTGQ